jgi:hypothetical protein
VPEYFNMKTLGEVVAKALCLKSGDDIQIQRDRLDPNRVMIVRRRSSESCLSNDERKAIVKTTEQSSTENYEQ